MSTFSHNPYLRTNTALCGNLPLISPETFIFAVAKQHPDVQSLFLGQIPFGWRKKEVRQTLRAILGTDPDGADIILCVDMHRDKVCATIFCYSDHAEYVVNRLNRRVQLHSDLSFTVSCFGFAVHDPKENPTKPLVVEYKST